MVENFKLCSVNWVTTSSVSSAISTSTTFLYLEPHKANHRSRFWGWRRGRRYRTRGRPAHWRTGRTSCSPRDLCDNRRLGSQRALQQMKQWGVPQAISSWTFVCCPHPEMSGLDLRWKHGVCFWRRTKRTPKLFPQRATQWFFSFLSWWSLPFG